MSKFKIGDKVEVVKNRYGMTIGEIYTLVEECNDSNMWRDNDRMEIEFNLDFFDFENEGCFKLYKRGKEQIKNIKPEDEITITTTYGELARVYAILGNANGIDYGKSLWKTASEVFNDSWDETENKKFWEFESSSEAKSENIFDYVCYQKEWEKVLFNQKSEKDLKIEELEKTIAEAQKQLQELKEM